MSIDNLMLTEHAIKRHAKRLQKQMKNYNQDITLGESQTLLSKILGFNDWNHLNTILKSAIEESQKDVRLLNSIKKSIYTKVAVISSSHTICKAINLFLSDSEIRGDYYICETFENISSYKIFVKNNKENFDFIICDEDYNNANINKPINCSIIYLTNETKEEVFYRLMSKLFFANKFIEAIKELKKYINENKGNVDSKIWKLFLSLCQKNCEKEYFDNLLLVYAAKFGLNDNIDYNNFSFIPEHNYENYFLSKPFSKDTLFKTLFFSDYFKK